LLPRSRSMRIRLRPGRLGSATSETFATSRFVMKIYQSRTFEKKAKKMSKSEKDSLDREIKRIAEDPSIGEEKKGDLRGVFIHKFKLKTTQYLLAYRRVDNDLELVMFGPHENYYRDLKQYLKAR